MYIQYKVHTQYLIFSATQNAKGIKNGKMHVRWQIEKDRKENPDHNTTVKELATKDIKE